MTTYSDDEVQVLDQPKQSFSDADVQVTPQALPAASQAPPAPKDPRPVSQTLGFAKQAAQRLKMLSDRAENDPHIRPWIDALDDAVPGVDVLRRVLKDPLQTQAIPYLQKQEQTYQPGGAGKVAADLTLGAGVGIAAPEFIGLLGSGALSGAALSDAPATDTKGLLRDTAIGGVLNRVGAPIIDKALGAVGNVGANLLAKVPKPPLAADLRKTASAMYDRLHDMKVTYAPPALGDLADRIQKATVDIPGNVDPEVNKSVLSVLNNNVLPRLRDAADKGVGMSLKELDKMRQGVYDKIGDPATNSKDNRRLAWEVMNQMNGFVNTATDDMIHVPAEMGAGAAQSVALQLRNAKQLFARSAKTQQIEDIIKSAQLRAAVAHGGGNINNTIRQRLRPLVDPTSPKMLRGATPEETAQIERVANGTAIGNAARVIGQAAPSRGGLSLIGTAIAGHLNPMLLAGSALAQGAKGIADSSTERGVQKLLNMVASGGQGAALAARELSVRAVKDSAVGRMVTAAGLSAGDLGRIAGTQAAMQAAQGVTEAPLATRPLP